jgi:hypothetical protein
MNVNQLALQLIGMEDNLACYLFDEAVMWFGTKIENKLHDFDQKTGKPRFTLDYLLKEPEKRKNPSANDLRHHFGNVTGIEIG